MVQPRRTEIKKIEDLSAMHVCFSKRRKGLFRKAKEWSVSYGAEVAVIVFSKTGKLYEFSSTNTLFKYNNNNKGAADVDSETLNATMPLQEQIASLKWDCSQMRGLDFNGLSFNELHELETQITQVLTNTRKRKDDRGVDHKKKD